MISTIRILFFLFGDLLNVGLVKTSAANQIAVVTNFYNFKFGDKIVIVTVGLTVHFLSVVLAAPTNVWRLFHHSTYRSQTM